MPNNTIVREYALNQVGNPYVYGGTGQPCTPAYREARMRQYPQYASLIRDNCPALSGKTADCGGCRHRGKRCYDCAQLVRRALGAAGITLPSGASTQWLKGDWAYRGAMDDRAKTTVCVLFRAGGSPMKHVGLSLGDGRTVDARGHRAGVVLSAFEAYPWTHYALWADEKDGKAEKGEFKMDVREAQHKLEILGFPLPRFGADGKWGLETRTAVTGYQRARGLNITGALDDATVLALANEMPLMERVSLLEKRMSKLEGVKDEVRA